MHISILPDCYDSVCLSRRTNALCLLRVLRLPFAWFLSSCFILILSVHRSQPIIRFFPLCHTSASFHFNQFSASRFDCSTLLLPLRLYHCCLSHVYVFDQQQDPSSPNAKPRCPVYEALVPRSQVRSLLTYICNFSTIQLLATNVNHLTSYSHLPHQPHIDNLRTFARDIHDNEPDHNTTSRLRSTPLIPPITPFMRLLLLPHRPPALLSIDI